MKLPLLLPQEAVSTSYNTVGGGEVDIILDVCQAPKFTLQRVEDIRGGFLLVLYDSGALTSGIKTSVAASLMSKTVGSVPISISAMGGGGELQRKILRGHTCRNKRISGSGLLINLGWCCLEAVLGYLNAWQKCCFWWNLGVFWSLTLSWERWAPVAAKIFYIYQVVIQHPHGAWWTDVWSKLAPSLWLRLLAMCKNTTYPSGYLVI